ncbi:MAG: HipA N-terminal domain-containing protein [Deltaproteobacteria bacterium]|nr:HipA N-terminal domain-containing protein [Deltaproteobacteria bacterium]
MTRRTARGARAREGIVRLDGVPVGRIREVEGGTSFVYDAEWLARADAAPVSLTMPLRSEPYVSRGLHPFFENLLPEGWLLEIATTKLKIPKDDAFGLLLGTCADCIGAVEILRVGASRRRR